jgi:hypothetical protein
MESSSTLLLLILDFDRVQETPYGVSQASQCFADAVTVSSTFNQWYYNRVEQFCKGRHTRRQHC